MNSDQLQDVGKLARDLDSALTSRSFQARSLAQASAQLEEWKKKAQDILDNFDSKAPAVVKNLGIATRKIKMLETEVRKTTARLEKGDSKIANLQRALTERTRNMNVEIKL